jgi:drug/metabolite transporter (DMT)-like permease
VLYFLALASAALYGAADFLGGLASRRATTVAVVIVSQLAGLLLLAAMMPFLPEAQPSTSDLWWGVAAGVFGGMGVALLYRALAIGTMAVVAPTTAVCAVAIPVLAAVALGERPSLRVAAGIVLAIVAIVLVSRSNSTPGTPGTSSTPGTLGTPGTLSPGLGLALASGVAIGFFFLSLARTGSDAGMWPLVSARAVSVALFSGIALATGRSVRLPRPAATLAVVGGAVDMLANALYLVASRSGPLSVVVTLASLYPASTVILARVVLGERLTPWQGAGIACALVAVVLIVG